MFIIIFLSVLLAAVILILIQLRASVNNGPITKILQQNESCTDSIMAREKVSCRKKRAVQFAEMEKRKLRSDTKDEALWQQAYADHDHAVKTNYAQSVSVHPLYSQRLIDEYTVVPHPNSPFPPPPSSLGMWLARYPNTRYMNDIMRGVARAPIGAVIPWHRLIVRDVLISDSVMVRVNTPYRWIHLSVTRYETDSREEIICTFLKTLDTELFADPSLYEKVNPTGEWMMWDPITHTLKTN